MPLQPAIKITIPADNLPERRYIIEEIFGEFLGLEFEISSSDEARCWEIALGGRRLVIQDDFFIHHPAPHSYCHHENIPKRFDVCHWKGHEIAILYGEGRFENREDGDYCGVDIFAGAFFMLSRWEEIASQEALDSHGRFPASSSVALRLGFLERPIVNEYVEFLWEWLKGVEPALVRKPRAFEVWLTHDVDLPTKFLSWRVESKRLFHYAWRQRAWSKAWRHLGEKLAISLGLRRDPYDTFDFLMQVSQKQGLKSHFFFKAPGEGEFDKPDFINSNLDFLRRLARKIKAQGHEVGFHPTYFAHNDKGRFLEDRAFLEELTGESLRFGRNHFLRFENPSSWRVWNEAGMVWDSTLGYADRSGFRCGVCYPFHPFDVQQRERLRLLEIPLIAMEGTLFYYEKLGDEEVSARIDQLAETTRHFKGAFVLLWHNSELFSSSRRQLYEGIVMNLKAKEAQHS